MIAFYVAKLATHMPCHMADPDPSIEAYEAGLDIVSYLRNTPSLGITYDASKPPLVIFTDSSYSQSPMPFGGHAILMYGGVVSYHARKLKIVPQSAHEAELAVYATTCKDFAYVRNVWGSEGLQMPTTLPAKVHCDNDAAVSTVMKPGATQRTKHYEAWVMYGREQWLNKVSKPEWIATTYNVADIFTKPLDKTTFLKFRAGLLNLPSELIVDRLAEILTHG